jgi:hypothetical protein
MLTFKWKRKEKLSRNVRYKWKGINEEYSKWNCEKDEKTIFI